MGHSESGGVVKHGRVVKSLVSLGCAALTACRWRLCRGRWWKCVEVTEAVAQMVVNTLMGKIG